MIAGKTRSVHRRIEDDRRHNDERASQKRGKNAASIDIAEDMLETPSVRDTLAKLNPRTKPGEKNRAIVEANREEIYAARDRGCTWADISQALAEAGIAIGPNTLRLMMSERPRDLKKYPRKMLAERKPRQPVQQSSIKGKEEYPLEKKNSNANVGKAMKTPMDKIAAESPDQPLPERFPIPSTASQFLELEEKL